MLLLLLLPSLSIGQGPSGSIVGSVKDETGASLSHAKIVLKDSATEWSRKTESSGAGTYEFFQLSPGTYDLSIDAAGFRRTVERNIQVNVESAVHLDVILSVGDTNETVNVIADPGSIEQDKVSIDTVVDTRSIRFLPLQDRQFLNLALVAPGTVPGAPGTKVAGTSVETFSVSGMRSQSNNYTLDGISNNDPHVNGPLNSFRLADAVQEFSVQTAIPGPDAGHSSGSQVRIVTKSGGNSYHGTLFYYVRNDVLDASPYFLKRAGVPRNSLHRNQFGGTAGGFIQRDKTFWFVSFEEYRQMMQVAATARIPTDAERAAVTDPISKSLLQFWPIANTPQFLFTTGKNWAGTTPDKDNDETYLGRIDHNLTSNHRLALRYAWFTGDTLTRQNSPFNGLITNSPAQRSLLLQDTYSTSRAVNEFRLGYSANRVRSIPADVNLNASTIFRSGTGEALPGFIDSGRDRIDGGLPTITIGGLTDGGLGVGANFPQGRTTSSYEFLDDFSITGIGKTSRHALHLGVAARRETDENFQNAAFRGAISFPSWSTFTSGMPQRGSLATGTDETFRVWSREPISWYAQDVLRLRPSLTLNFGIRWEYPGKLSEKHDRGSNFVPGVGIMNLNSHSRIDVDRTLLGRSALLENQVDTFLPATGQFRVLRRNFEPFLGIAYSPAIWYGMFGENKTVIRAGFRISHDDVFDGLLTLMGLNAPSVLATTLPRNVYTWASALNQNQRLFSPDVTVPGTVRGVLTFNAVDANPSTPYAMTYAVGIERELGKASSVEISYVGSRGRKLLVESDPNQPTVTVIDPQKRGDQAPNLRSFPYLQYSNILQGSFVGTSNSNALSVVASEHAVGGLSFLASYELSRSFDENSEFFPTDGDPSTLADSRNRAIDYGPSAFDVRHRIIASFVYQAPAARWDASHSHASNIGRLLRSNWTISGITNYRSGFPFTVRASSDIDFTGLNRWTPAGFADRADKRPGVTVVPHNMSNPDGAFDPQVFNFPKAGTPGNAGRNSMTGPHSITQDFALIRTLSLRERADAQIRLESFNAFNHTNFKLPENRLDQSSVGKIGASYDPRLLQLSLRLQW